MNKTHRPCFWLFLVLAMGIMVGHFFPVDLRSWLIAASVMMVYFLFVPKIWPLYAALFCLGAALIHVAHPLGVDFLEGWREQLRASLYHYLDDHEAGSMSAIVLGDRGHIPKEINMVFRHTGTGHILVIAGLHMAMLTAMIFFCLKMIGIPRFWQVWGSILLLLIFAIMTGGSIPVMRAVFMASVVLAAYAVENESDPLNSLSLAGLILLLMDAQNLFDTGFQLSFAAVAAIVTLCKPIEESLSFLPKWLASMLAVSTAAWIGITPLQLWHFGTITPVALVANLFIVPLLDLTVALGLSLALAGLGLPTMAWALAGCLKAVFNLMIIITYWFSLVPFGYIQLRS